MFNVFSWLSARAEEAVLAGVGRALARLDCSTDKSDDARPAIDGMVELKARLGVAGESQLPHRNGKKLATAQT